MQTLETFSVINVHVRIFLGLDRNDLMYSLRICEIFLFMNAKVLFLVICLVSAILYVTRHLVFALSLDDRDTKKKIKKIKKNATQNLTRCPHGPSKKVRNQIYLTDATQGSHPLLYHVIFSADDSVHNISYLTDATQGSHPLLYHVIFSADDSVHNISCKDTHLFRAMLCIFFPVS